MSAHTAGGALLAKAKRCLYRL